MNLIKKYFWQILVVGLVILLFLQRSCQEDIIKNDPNVIITEPKIGGFDYYKPVEIDKTNYLFITKDGDTIEIENPVNKELEQKYLNTLSENEKLKLYLEAIQKRTYVDTLENKHIKFSYIALTTGTLDSIKFDYEVKSDTLKIKQPVFNLLGGLSLQSNINTLKTYPGLNIGFQNKKKDILLFEYNTNKDISVIYIKNIFTIKK
jgi:hypothetical protein